MTGREYGRLLKGGGLRGGYLFFGEEEYTKHAALRQTREALFPEGDNPFGHVMLSGAESGWQEALAGELMSLSMFGDKKLIEVHGVDYGKLSSSALEELYATLDEQKDNEESVLILYAERNEFDAGSLPKRPSALMKNFEKHCTVVQFGYESQQALSAWLMKRFEASGVRCSTQTAEKMIAFCSRDMFALSNEADKLICYTLAAGRTEADPRDIEDVCCGQSIDGAFDFTDALLKRDAARACRLLKGMEGRREKPEAILAGVIDTLGNMFTVRRLIEEGYTQKDISEKTGLHPFRVGNFCEATAGKKSSRLERALKLCAEADTQIKSSGLDNYTVLERLVMRLSRI